MSDPRPCRLPWLLLALTTAPSPSATQEPTPAPAVAPAPEADSVSPLFCQRAARREQFRNAKVLEAVRSGIGWLLAHQDADGRWNADDFCKHDPADDVCSGGGNPTYDVGVTALALLAILAQADAVHADATNKAADWLVKYMDQKTGRIVSDSHEFIYMQALSTLALVETAALLGNGRHRTAAEAGLRFLGTHRNPKAAWRYQPGDGESDTSVTSWCLAAYGEAVNAGFTVPAADVGAALAWLDQITDFATGACGYMKRHEPSARKPGPHAERFPPERGAAMTAAALHGRLGTGLPPSSPLALVAADELGTKLPAWEPKAIDLYYWFHASAALAMMPDAPAAKRWDAALQKALVTAQHKQGSAKGSWDPIDAWGEDSGRVGTTAFAVLALSSPWRLGRCDASAQIPDQVPLRRLHAQLQAGKIGEAAGEAARIDAAALAPPQVHAVARLQWLIEIESSHTQFRLAKLEKVEPNAHRRIELLEAICERLSGLPIAGEAMTALRQLRSDPKLQKEVAAAKDLRPLLKAYDAWRAAPTSSKRRQVRDDLLKFIAKYPDTEAGKTAQQLADSM